MGALPVEILLVGALAGFLICLRLIQKSLAPERPRRRWDGRPKLIWNRDRRISDAADQLRHVMTAPFFKRKIMNKEEYNVFRVVEQEIQTMKNGCRVLSQTSLGEILSSPSKDAYASINSKRVDILIIARNGEPVAAIEYQGSGHHQGSAAARDAVKKEALRRAGVGYIEISEQHSEGEIVQLIRRLFPAVAQTGHDSTS